ncbi:MAG: hypothetical protein U0Q55_15220 [Vicinamibacterales bacterium]
MDVTQRLTRIYTIDLPRGRTTAAGRVLADLRKGQLMFFGADGAEPEWASVPPEMLAALQEWVVACEGAVEQPAIPEPVRVYLSVTFGRAEAPAQAGARAATSDDSGELTVTA